MILPWEIMEMVDKTRFTSWDGLELQTWYFIEKNIHCIISRFTVYISLHENDKYTHGSWILWVWCFQIFAHLRISTSFTTPFGGFPVSKNPMRSRGASERIPASWRCVEIEGKLGEEPSKKHEDPPIESMTMHTNRSLKSPTPQNCSRNIGFHASTGRDSGFPSGAGAVICSWLDPSKKHHPHSLNLTVDAPEN